MTVNNIFSTLENVAKIIDGREGKERSIKESFDKKVGINKEQHDEVVSLTRIYEDAEESVKQYDKEIEQCTQSLKKLDSSIQKLEENLKKTKTPESKEKVQKEIDKKKDEREKLQTRKENLSSSQFKEKQVLRRAKRKLNKQGVDPNTAKQSLGKMDKALTKNASGGLSNMLGKLPKMAGPIAAVGALVNAIEFGIDKSTQYLRLNTENTLRLISATATGTLNQMKVSMDAWQDAVDGAYSAQEMAIGTQLAMIEAQNATAMANLKMQHTWTNWIPIWKQVNEYGETQLEQEQKMQEAWMKNAKEQLSMLNQYSKRIDTYNKAQDKAVHAYQAEAGLSPNQTSTFEDRMLGLGETFAKYNKTIEDALKMQSSYTEQSGRSVNFSNMDYEKNFAVGRLVGEDNLMNFESQMNLFNVSVSDAADIMYDMYKDVNRMGLSQKKVTKDVLGNLKLAQKYDFKNGTKGFMELAKWAENARFNLGSLGGALEKIQSGGLENTITTSAKLQVLGGPFAMLSDPLGMEFEANAAPDAYAKRIQKMFSTMGRFDKETGPTTFNYAENKMIRSAAESLGISVEDAKNMARGARQKDVVKQQMRYSTLKPEDQDAIANKAQYDKNTGQWYVNTISGKKMNVGDVKAQDLDKILSGNKEEDAMKYAQSTLSVTEQIEATTKQINAQLGLLTFDKFKEMSKEEMSTVLDAYSKYQTNIEKLYSQQKSDNVQDLKEALKDNLSKILTNYNRNRTIVKSNGSRMSDDEDEDAGLKFAAGDRTNKTSDKVKVSAKAREQLNAKDIEDAYNTDTRSWFRQFGDWITGINSKNARRQDSERDPQSVKAQQSNTKSSNEMRTRMWEAAAMAMPDGVVSGNGSPMMVSASDVTPIQDGAVKLAKSDPKDSAIFAKTGGPFDKLFDDIFGKVNAIYDMSVRYGSTSTTNNRYGGDVVQSMLENHFANVFGSTSTTNNRYDRLGVLYDSWRDPHAHAKRMQEFGNGIGRINPRTGERMFNFSENMQMARMAKIQGRNFDDVRNDFTRGNYIEPAPGRKRQELAMPSVSTINELAKIATQGNTGSSISQNQGSQTLDVHIHGDINLKSPTGETFNISKQIESDPMLIRKITEMMVTQIGNNLNGGRTELFRNRYSTT